MLEGGLGLGVWLVHGTDLYAHASCDVVQEGLDLGLAALHVGRGFPRVVLLIPALPLHVVHLHVFSRLLQNVRKRQRNVNCTQYVKTGRFPFHVRLSPSPV